MQNLGGKKTKTLIMRKAASKWISTDSEVKIPGKGKELQHQEIYIRFRKMLVR